MWGVNIIGGSPAPAQVWQAGRPVPLQVQAVLRGWGLGVRVTGEVGGGERGGREHWGQTAGWEAGLCNLGFILRALGSHGGTFPTLAPRPIPRIFSPPSSGLLASPFCTPPFPPPAAPLLPPDPPTSGPLGWAELHSRRPAAPPSGRAGTAPRGVAPAGRCRPSLPPGEEAPARVRPGVPRRPQPGAGCSGSTLAPIAATRLCRP